MLGACQTEGSSGRAVGRRAGDVMLMVAWRRLSLTGEVMPRGTPTGSYHLHHVIPGCYQPTS